MRTLLCLAGLLASLAGPAAAQQASTAPDKIDQYIESQMSARHIPGLALLVVRDGQIIKARGYGFANLEHKVLVKSETVFQSGSIGKQFTATAVMMLVEDGKIALDDRISQYFKDAPASWKDVTVRQLLSHAAGFTDYPRDFNFRADYAEDELLKKAVAIPLAFTPGTKWQYSVPNRAAGYRLVKGEVKNQAWVSPTMNTTADGSLYVNILDMAKWDAALYTDKLLKPASLQLMWTPVKLSDGKPNSAGYGFGWRMGEIRGHRIIEHAGAWQGFASNISRYVDDRLTVVVLANLAGGGPDAITHRVAGLCEPALTPLPEKPIEDKEPQVTALLTNLLQDIADGKKIAGIRLVQ